MKKSETGLQRRDSNLPALPTRIGTDIELFSRQCSKLTPAKSAELRVAGQAVSLYSLRREDDVTEEDIQEELCMLISDLQDKMNLHENRRLDDDQIMDIALIIFDHHGNMTMADIGMVFSKAKAGMYGNVLTISSATIGDWINREWENIQQRVITLRQQEHRMHKSGSDSRDQGMNWDAGV